MYFELNLAGIGDLTDTGFQSNGLSAISLTIMLYVNSTSKLVNIVDHLPQSIVYHVVLTKYGFS